MNTLTWILVADASRARIFSVHKAALFQSNEKVHSLTLVKAFSHAASREKDTTLMTDNLGRFDHGVFIERTDPKWHEAEVFAGELSAYLEENRIAHTFRDVILVTPPAFMGLLNNVMPNTLAKCVSQRIENDYSQLKEAEVLYHLMPHF